MKHIEDYIDEIKKIFLENADRYKCHALASPILEELSRNKLIIADIIRKNLLNSDFVNRSRHYSTLAMDVFENNQFTLLVNIFPPLPDRSTDITFQSIHHHGSLLLSTVGFHGNGYSSILYKKGFQIDPKTQETNLEIIEYYQNVNHEVKFCDAYQPHVVFYPNDFSSTLVLWSEKENRPKDNIKALPLISKLKKPLGKLIRNLRMEGVVGINKIENYDFYRSAGKYYALKERKAYDKSCSNENFLQNFFSYVQALGFDDMEFLNNLKLSSHFPNKCHYLIDKLIQNEKIEDDFCEHHLNIPFVNLHKKDLLP